MGTKITVSTIAGSYASIAELNNNFAQLADEFDKVVYRDGTAPNSWSATQDANSNRLINLANGADDYDAVTMNQLEAAIVGGGGYMIATLPFTAGSLLYADTVATLASLSTLTFVGTADAEEFNLVGNSTTVSLQTTASLTHIKALGTASNIDMRISPKGTGLLHTDRFGQIGENVTTASVSSTYAIDCTKGTVFQLTMTADTTFTFTNPLSSGIGQSFTLILKQDSSGTWTATLPTVKWGDGTPPTLTTTANAIDILSFFTPDGGTTWYGFTGGTTFA